MMVKMNMIGQKCADHVVKGVKPVGRRKRTG